MAAKRKFSFDMVASGSKQAIGTGMPKVRDLELRGQHEGDVPKIIVDNFEGTKIICAFDIETHAGCGRALCSEVYGGCQKLQCLLQVLIARIYKRTEPTTVDWIK